MAKALYRKYRPKRFSDVIGQDAICAALKNQVSSGKVSHAYMLTGIRGTGKTTLAKILSKAVNCPNQKDGEPCCECDVCRGIDTGAILDVTEIDAASNNSVDDIRQLKEESSFAPAVCRYRIYIIDEVHADSECVGSAPQDNRRTASPHHVYPRYHRYTESARHDPLKMPEIRSAQDICR